MSLKLLFSIFLEIIEMDDNQIECSPPKIIRFRCCDDIIVELFQSDCEQCGTFKAMLINTNENHEDDDIIPLATLSSKDMEGLKTWLSDKTLPNTIGDLLQSVVVANFLEVDDLLSAACKRIHELVSDKVPSQLKILFGNVQPTISERSDYSLLFEQEPYKGEDPNLAVNMKTCYNICENPSMDPKLFTCTGCRLMKYCSRSCQKENWSTHKKECRAIQRSLKDTEKERQKLMQIDGANVFIDYMGHLWGNHDARDYCRARLQLADNYLALAHYEEHASMYEARLENYLELQRLIRGDNMGLRDKTPFILINLNRDEDAYDFVKHWLTVDEDWYCKPKQYAEGEWMYLRGEDRFEDPSPFIRPGLIGSSLAHTVTILILKLRIVAKHAADLKQFKAVWELIEKDGRWQALTDIRDILKCHLVGDTKYLKLMDEQLQHIDLLFNAVKNSNSIFLKAVVNPGPLLSQPYPDVYSRGSAEEAFLVLNDCCRTFRRIPGAIESIKGFLGFDIDYNPTFKFYWNYY